MKKCILLLLITLGLFSSCKDDAPALDLNFKLEYAGEPLVMFEDLTYPNGMEMFLTRFSFYLSDLKIGNQEIDDIYYIDLTADHVDLSSAMEGFKLSLKDLAEEEVNEISFTIGLSPNLNATSPADYLSSSPLSLGSEYWSTWGSYIFSKVEAKIDADGDGMKEFNVALHLGLDDAMRELTLNNSFSLSEGSTASQDIIIDLYDYFDGTQGVYDVIAVPQMTTSTIGEINELADNMVAATRIE